MRGGKREGAGRPATGTRPLHGVRAFDDEWEIISPFINLVKSGYKKECEQVLKDLVDKTIKVPIKKA